MSIAWQVAERLVQNVEKVIRIDFDQARQKPTFDFSTRESRQGQYTTEFR